ncbi:synaptobrevin-like protein [Acrasis kona]|uniref:Synaptobrevin-like protein n=1 Tax=Acrasis kona TaxID=1008807 RepID=A0AAW2Z2R3_9EUKA
MKLLAINILRYEDSNSNVEPIILTGASDLSSFGFFQRGGVSEFITFISRLLAKRTEKGTRQQVEKDGYNCYVHSRTNNLVGVLVADQEYNPRVAFSVLYQALLDFEKKFTQKQWTDAKQDNDCDNASAIQALLTKYQNPTETDDLLKIRKELEETKAVMNQAIENVLHRGEKIDDLVDQSTDLSMSSKAFYNSVPDNSCCTIQ